MNWKKAQEKKLEKWQEKYADKMSKERGEKND